MPPSLSPLAPLKKKQLADEIEPLSCFGKFSDDMLKHGEKKKKQI